MTRDEIMAMEPGRELDALVAEKVMGINIYWCRSLDGVLHPQFLRSYSTDISAAWEVVEHMRNEAPPQRHEFRDLLNLGIFKITPEAICKSALLAVMDRTEELPAGDEEPPSRDDLVDMKNLYGI